jgi:hypothetical protein
MSHAVLQRPAGLRFDDTFSTPGLSEAATTVENGLREAFVAYREPVTSQRSAARSRSLEQRFRSLAAEWEEETGHLSAVTQIAMHPAYQQIIGMGPEVVPLILADLARTGSHWFWALTAITGEQPVPPQDRGYVDRMVAAWLQWGRARGLP